MDTHNLALHELRNDVARMDGFYKNGNPPFIKIKETARKSAIKVLRSFDETGLHFAPLPVIGPDVSDDGVMGTIRMVWVSKDGKRCAEIFCHNNGHIIYRLCRPTWKITGHWWYSRRWFIERHLRKVSHWLIQGEGYEQD